MQKIKIRNLCNCGLWLYIPVFILCIINIFGCATSPYMRPALPQGTSGIYHRVEKGQTLWKICKIYNVDLEEIVRMNRISDASTIEVGQLVFIPNRQKQISIPLKYSSDDFIWPLPGRVIATFGQTYNNMINKGVNIQPHNSLDVIASRAGRVAFYSEDLGSFGKTIILDHEDGFSTVYARNSQIFVKAGESIQKGTVIARVGSAGRDKNRYLHFEIRKGHLPQNPLFYLPR